MSAIEKLKARLAADGAELRGVTWGPEAVNLTDEERAAALLQMIEHFDCPRASLIGRLRGRAFLFSDKAMCMRSKFDTQTMELVELTPAERVQMQDADEMATLLNDAADMLEGDKA